MPFSSGRRWSGAAHRRHELPARGAGALRPGPLAEVARDRQDDGRRVLAFASTPGASGPVADGEPPPAGAPPLGLVVLGEELRAETRETIAFLRAQGIELKVLSGDSPATVAAIARDAGIPVERRRATAARLPATLPRCARSSRRRRRRAHLARGQAPRRRGARTGRAARGDGRRRRQRRPGAEGGATWRSRRGPARRWREAVADLVLVRGDFAASPPLVDAGRAGAPEPAAGGASCT